MCGGSCSRPYRRHNPELRGLSETGGLSSWPTSAPAAAAVLCPRCFAPVYRSSLAQDSHPSCGSTLQLDPQPTGVQGAPGIPSCEDSYGPLGSGQLFINLLRGWISVQRRGPCERHCCPSSDYSPLRWPFCLCCFNTV